jgi:hypothetical protein
VQPDGQQEHQPDNPEQFRVGKNWLADLPQTLGIRVELFGPKKHFEVAVHMTDDKPNPNQPGNRHNHLLTDCGTVERHDTYHTLLFLLVVIQKSK